MVGAAVRHGRGVVVALSLATQLADLFMGGEWSAVPSEPLRRLYQVEFDLLRAMLDHQVPRFDGRGYDRLPVGS